MNLTITTRSKNAPKSGTIETTPALFESAIIVFQLVKQPFNSGLVSTRMTK